VDAVVHRGVAPLAAVAELMTREPKDELASLEATPVASSNPP
jgi:hypothetical protein